MNGVAMRRFLSSIFQKYLRLQTPSVSLIFLLTLVNSTVIVQWLPNSEADLAGYKLYYGTASRSYPNIINVGLMTTHTVNDLQPGYEYFFAVTAYDTAGNESDFSEEVSIYIPDENDTTNTGEGENNNVYNFPNPFNPDVTFTQIRYLLNKTEIVTIVIYDVTGDEVRLLFQDIEKSAGEHIEDVWDGKDEKGEIVPNGIYYAHVKSESLNRHITIAVTR